MASIYLQKKTWWIQYYYNGKKIRHSLKVKEKRKALYLKNKKEIELEEGSSSTPSTALINQFFTKYKEYMYTERTNQRSILGDIQQLEKFFTFCPPRMKDVKVNHIKDYLLSLSKRKLKPKSRNNYLVNIKAFFNKAKDLHYIHHNPADTLKKLPVPKNPPRFLSEKEIETLFKTSKESETSSLYPLILTALYTGCRIGELINLEWKDVDLKAQTLTIQGSNSKSKKFKVIPLMPKVCKALKATQNGCSYVFNYGGRRYSEQPRRAFKTILKHAGIPNCGFHTLRHSCASHLVKNKVDIYAVSKILGHSSVAMTQIYAHLAPDYLKDTVKRLPF